MALDFPANPTNGQVYDSYVYNSTVGAWQAREESATVATISPVFPATANPGDIWYDNDDGTSYIYYDDGTSAQWVELLSSGLPLLDTKADLSGATFTGNVTAPRFISTQATGTAPLTVASTTTVTNLSADLLDGNHSTAFAPAAGSANITTLGTITSGTWNGSIIPITYGGTGTATGTVSDINYRKIVNPDGATFTTTSNVFTGAIRIVLPVGWTSHMHKFNVSVFNYNSLKSFDVAIAGYNYSGGTWVNPTAYILGNQGVSINYPVRFGYTAGGKACVYIGETTSTWNYPQIAVNNVLVGFGTSSSDWTSGWIVDFVTAFESVTQTVLNTQIVSGLIPIIPSSVTINAGTASVSATGEISFNGGSVLTVNDIFSAAYRNYRIIYETPTISGACDIYAQFKNSGGTLTTGYVYARSGTSSGGTFAGNFNTSQSQMVFSRSSGAQGCAFVADIINPFQAKDKKAFSIFYESTTIGTQSNFNASTTSYTGLVIFPNGQTATNGTMKVYGYN